MELYRPSQHEPLTEAAWDESRVRAGVAAIVADAEAALGDEGWPVHPGDDDGDLPVPPTTLYLGSAGTMLAARAAGFDDAWRESAERLWAEWDEETDLWTQLLFGRPGQHVGPAHGAAGNIHALRGYDDDALRERTTRQRHALRDGELVNWPPDPTSRPDEIRVQWCHGAPGIVATVGDLLALDLARGGAELTWRAGPLAKGCGLCHGTAGNGYTLLKLFALTGDELWLHRARRFAVRALEQVERARAEHGRGRYSLWTGDARAALFAQACLDGDARVPTIDVW